MQSDDSDQESLFGLFDYDDVPSLPRVSSKTQLAKLVASLTPCSSPVLSTGGSDGRQQTHLMTKSKLSDVFVPRVEDKKKSRSIWIASFLLFGAFSLLFLREFQAREMVARERPDIRVASTLFRRAAAQGDAGAFIDGTVALEEWLDRLGCGLSSLVDVNVRKLLDRDVRGENLDAILLREKQHSVQDEDWSATVATTWNGRVLEFIAVFLDELVKEPSLDSAKPSAAAKISYAKTLRRHHNGFMRFSANALLSAIPDAKTLFQMKFGYQSDEVDSVMRRDITELRNSLFVFINKLRIISNQLDIDI